jgi:glutathione S-transferase
MKTLYQFPFSHFCEKARWALDYKRQAYGIRNLLAGPHTAVTKKLAPKTCVPILVDGDTVIQGSSEIISYLDKLSPLPPLTPVDANLADEALEWEQYFDEHIGVSLRCWFYYHVLPLRPVALKLLLQDAPWYGTALYALIFPKVKDAMTQAMNINAESAREAERSLVGAFTRMNEALKDGRYLVGNQFSRADLTACALLSQFCLSSPQFDGLLPAPIAEFRRAHANQPFFQWVRRIYADHRTPMRAAA